MKMAESRCAHCNLAPWNIRRLRLSWGPGPEGETCKTCRHLTVNRNPTVKTYYKCRLGAITGGPATDVRLRWPACGRWEEKGVRIQFPARR